VPHLGIGIRPQIATVNRAASQLDPEPQEAVTVSSIFRRLHTAVDSPCIVAGVCPALCNSSSGHVIAHSSRQAFFRARCGRMGGMNQWDQILIWFGAVPCMVSGIASLAVGNILWGILDITCGGALLWTATRLGRNETDSPQKGTSRKVANCRAMGLVR
jgi:hypothetical protein